MGVLKKGRATLRIGARAYLWWVCPDEASSDDLLHVVSEDKRFAVTYAVGQSQRPNPCVVVMGPEFVGLHDAGGCWIRVQSPAWGDDVQITPRFVRRLVDWSMDESNPRLRVDWRGVPVAPSVEQGASS